MAEPKDTLQLPRRHERKLSGSDMVFDETPRGGHLELTESTPRVQRARRVEQEIPAIEVTQASAETLPPAAVKLTIYQPDDSERSAMAHSKLKERKEPHKQSADDVTAVEGDAKVKKEKKKHKKGKQDQVKLEAKHSGDRHNTSKQTHAYKPPSPQPTADVDKKDAKTAPLAKVASAAVQGKPVLVPNASVADMYADKSRKLTLKEGNIGVICDDYNDIFSDFDPRPYNMRILSKDFIDECRRQWHGGDALRILIPEDHRSRRVEAVIKDRLTKHFKGVRHTARKKFWTLIVVSLILIGLGILLSVLRVYLKWSQRTGVGWLTLNAALDPTAAFMIWSGLERILFDIWGLSSKLNSAKKLAHIEISFVGYGKQYQKQQDVATATDAPLDVDLDPP